MTKSGLQARYDQESQRGRIAETERAALADQVDRKVNDIDGKLVGGWWVVCNVWWVVGGGWSMM